MIYLSAILIAMFLTIVLVPICRHLAFRLNIIDMPDARRVHTVPTPRTGGIAMALGALAPVLLWSHLSDFTASVMVGAWILVLFGLIDDRRDLNYKAKFAGQLAAAIIVVWFGGVKITSLGMLLPDGYILPDFLAIPLTILAIVGLRMRLIWRMDWMDWPEGLLYLYSYAWDICPGKLKIRLLPY
jgi:UDP-GlcNAc:undecaprenyl-phosphate GlcNAc-1-phosphate transferase